MYFLKEKATISTFLLDWPGLFSCDISLLWQTLKFYTEIKKASDGGVEGNDRQLLTGRVFPRDRFQNHREERLNEREKRPLGR